MDDKPKKEKNLGGRPTIFTEELANKICDLIATHPVGYNTLLNLYPELPDRSTFLAWRLKYDWFSTKYLEAKKFQAEILVEEIDNLIPEGLVYYTDEKGQERIDSPSAGLLIAKINNRKWTAARLVTNIYGDRQQVNTTVTIKHEDALKDLE